MKARTGAYHGAEGRSARVLPWAECPWSTEAWDGRVPICVASCPSRATRDGGQADDVMGFIVRISQVSQGLASVGFDFAGSQATLQDDVALWAAIESMKASWENASGEEQDQQFGVVEGLLKATRWWSLYDQSVVGSAKSSCQMHPQLRCIVYCIEGGLASQIEAKSMPEIISRVDLPPGSLEPEFAIRRGSFGDFQAFVKDATFRMAMGGPTLPPMVRPPGTPRRQLSTSAPPARPARVVHAAPLPGVIAAAAAAAAAADANSQETVASLLASCRLSQVRDAECEGEGERLGGECW